MRKPNIRDNTWIHENAVVMGDVELEEFVNIWPCAVLRGDIGKISVGCGTNIQDNCVIHTAIDGRTKIGSNVTIGHAAILHDCIIEDECIIGMGSIIMDGAVVEKNSIIGAGALVKPNMKVPEGSVVVGNPGRIVRKLSDEERKKIIFSAKIYIENAFFAKK